ncbi:glycosyltransferase family 4 protein [Alkalisalibacterium limincola]|uniref:Glycosyltransferase family 4 protein n=2 Tax=Alkalisalibacterium limincola TaxID=2699169 RepID=A0A5C8KV28_9GAMM|nr:glycosyltransferase family 4 protein [Alkalisalibacterium limincola]
MVQMTAPTRVLMVATSFPENLEDWRGLFIRYMADALGRRADLSMRLWAPPGDVDPAVAFALTPGDRAWLRQLMGRGGIAHVLRNDGIMGKRDAVSLLSRLWFAYRRNLDCDLLHINWLQCALAVPRDTRPLLVTALGSDLALLQSSLLSAALRNRFHGRRVVVCPNADWMAEPLAAAFHGVAKVQFVPFGIHPAWFALSHAPTKPSKWLAVLRLTDAKLGPLLDWAAPLFADGRRELHLFGPMQEQIDLPAWIRFHGPVGPRELQERWFPSATGLVSLSRHSEGRPQVMLEAMAAGLPIVASDIPAHTSFLQHGKTGWICGSSSGFEEAIKALEQPETNDAMGRCAKAWARDEVGSWDDCAARYAKIYRRLLDLEEAT